MARGGKRAGAGRPRGAKGKRTIAMRELADKAMGEGITPLELMLTAMRDAWAANDRKTAVAIAVQAAPYVHSKLAAVEQTGNEKQPVIFEIVTGVPRAEDGPIVNGRASPH